MNARTRCFLCALALGAVLSAWASPVLACGYPEREWVLPTLGSRVPSNTRIWFYTERSYGSQELTSEDLLLEDADGAVVPTQLDVISLGERNFPRTLYVLTPLAPLLVGSTYLMKNDESGITRFDVTGGPDVKAPRTPTAVSREEYSQDSEENSCGEYALVTMEYELANPLEELMVVALDDYDSFDPETLSGTLFEAASSVGSFDEDGASIDYGTTPVAGWPDSNPKTVRSRAGTFDLAGNFSGWSEPVTIDLPPIPDSCAVTAPGLSGAGSSLMVMSAVLGFTFVRSATRRRVRLRHR